MDEIRKALTRKLGPLPAWAWGVVGAAGIWIIRGFRSSDRSDSTPSTIGETSVVPSLSGGGAPSPGYGAPGGDDSSVFISTPGFTYEGEGGFIETWIEDILAAQRSDTATGGGATGTSGGDPTGTSVNTITSTSTEDGVRALFNRYGVPLTYGVTESGDSRVARIAAEIDSGARTWQHLEDAIRRLANCYHSGYDWIPYSGCAG